MNRTDLAARAAAALCVLAACSTPGGIEPGPGSAGAGIEWRAWSDDPFALAQVEGRLVLLDLGAGWCHWCHVMEETTYRDPEVVALIRDHCVAVKVDQAARPDLARRYEDYGWPATILFRADGVELAKRRGYLPPAAMRAMLRAFVADPTPGPSIEAEPELEPAPDAVLSADQRAALHERWRAAWDSERRGWGTVHKYLDAAHVEYGLACGEDGDLEASGRAREVLDLAAAKLIDPVWGGLYQYSHGGDWDHPHYERIMAFQADGMRAYALAYRLGGNAAHLRAASDIRRFLDRFLSALDGAFYASMDADLVPGEHAAEYFRLDDAGRLARGVPRVDTRTFAREAGWAASAFVGLFEATGDASALERAVRAARWALDACAIDGGGFRHERGDTEGRYLADTLAMARACADLYQATADRAWLSHAMASLDFVERTFPDSRGGYATARVLDADRGKPWEPRAAPDENAVLARIAIRVHRHTTAPRFRAMAERALALAAAPAAIARFAQPLVQLADRELATEPVAMCVVGPKADARARALHRACLAYGAVHRRIEWLDAADGPLPDPAMAYAALERPCVYVCARGTCSNPVEEPAEVARVADGLRRRGR